MLNAIWLLRLNHLNQRQQVDGNYRQYDILLAGCPYGKYGDSCKLTCPENCIGLCDLDTGKCLLGCTVGWRGEKCDRGKRFSISE